METAAYRPFNGGTATGSQNYANSTEPEPARVTIQQGLDEQEKAIHQLFAAIGQLEERLTLVLSPPVPQPGEANAKAPTPSQVLDRVFTATNGIAQATEWLLRLNTRVQL